MNELIELIKRHEGTITINGKHVVYDDATGKPITAGYTCIGNPTIGIGRLLTGDNGLTEEEVDYLFGNDLQNTITDLQRNFDWFDKLDQVRADVVVSMVFNMGISRFHKFKNTIAAIERGGWGAAANEILDSKAARDLPRRYHELSEMMRTGER